MSDERDDEGVMRSSAAAKLREDLKGTKQQAIYDKEDEKRRQEDEKKQRIRAEQAAFDARLRQEASTEDMEAWSNKKTELETTADAAWEELDKKTDELLAQTVNGYDQYHASMSKVFQLQKQLCLALNASQKEQLHNWKKSKIALYAQEFGGKAGHDMGRFGADKKDAIMSKYHDVMTKMSRAARDIENLEGIDMPFSMDEREAMTKVNYAELIQVNDHTGELTLHSFATDDEYKKIDAHDEHAVHADKLLKGTLDVLLAEAGFVGDEQGCYTRVVDVDAGAGDPLRKSDLLDVLEGKPGDEFSNFFSEVMHASLEEANNIGHGLQR